MKQSFVPNALFDAAFAAGLVEWDVNDIPRPTVSVRRWRTIMVVRDLADIPAHA